MKIISASIDLAAVFEKEVLTFQVQNNSLAFLFNNEKADASVFLHVCNILLTSGTPHVLIKTVDTDVLISDMAILLHLELKKKWMGSGNGLYRVNIPPMT